MLFCVNCLQKTKAHPCTVMGMNEWWAYTCTKFTHITFWEFSFNISLNLTKMVTILLPFPAECSSAFFMFAGGGPGPEWRAHMRVPGCGNRFRCQRMPCRELRERFRHKNYSRAGGSRGGSTGEIRAMREP